ncbi:hypothetical protein [Streptomyces sp. NPDC058755]|uniref:hypothetical protein n=1 Tax=Streptomyces sp. NPDC058755 TaxID=3346624 RepID=UPI0036A08728
MPRPIRDLALLLGLVLAGLTTGCSSESAPVTAPPSTSQHPAGSQRLATVTYGVPADVITMVLPTTGAQSRATQGLDVFGKLAAARELSACAGRQGGNAPADEPPLMFTRFADLPDLEYLRVHGFGGGVLVPETTPTGPVATGTSPTAEDRLRRCTARARAVTRELHRLYIPLESQWFTQLASLRNDPDVRRAYRTFSACLAGHQVKAKDEETFFALADQRLQAADTVGVRRLSTAYATCMKPVEDVREPLREQLQERFRVAHTREISALRARLPSKIRDLETRYGIRFSVPSP